MRKVYKNPHLNDFQVTAAQYLACCQYTYGMDTDPWNVADTINVLREIRRTFRNRAKYFCGHYAYDSDMKVLYHGGYGGTTVHEPAWIMRPKKIRLRKPKLHYGRGQPRMTAAEIVSVSTTPNHVEEIWWSMDEFEDFWRRRSDQKSRIYYFWSMDSVSETAYYGKWVSARMMQKRRK